MSNLGTVTKQVSEVHEYTRDFASIISSTSAASVASTSVTVTPSGLTVTSSNTTSNATITYSGGSNETNYKVTLLTTMDNGLIYEDELYVTITNT